VQNPRSCPDLIPQQTRSGARRVLIIALSHALSSLFRSTGSRPLASCVCILPSFFIIHDVQLFRLPQQLWHESVFRLLTGFTHRHILTVCFHLRRCVCPLKERLHPNWAAYNASHHSHLPGTDAETVNVVAKCTAAR